MTIIGFIQSTALDNNNMNNDLRGYINGGRIETVGFTEDGDITEEWQNCQLILVDDQNFTEVTRPCCGNETGAVLLLHRSNDDNWKAQRCWVKSCGWEIKDEDDFSHSPGYRFWDNVSELCSVDKKKRAISIKRLIDTYVNNPADLQQSDLQQSDLQQSDLQQSDLQIDQLIQLIWLLLREDCKPRRVDLDTWWHKPFISDESVPSYLVLLERLSERCSYHLGIDKHQVEEIISAVLQKRGDSDGFSWTFADSTLNQLESEYKKKKFKELIDACYKELSNSDDSR